MRILAVLAAAAQIAAAQSFVQVAPSNPRYLQLSSGEPYIPIGPNIGWERFASAENEIFANTERRFRSLAANGGNFARVWISHPFYDLDPDSPRSAMEEKLGRIRRLLSIAGRNGIRVKLCLEHFRTTAADPPRFPGSVSMGRPELASRFGDITAFFTTSPGRGWFTRKLDLLAAEFKDEPAVFGWELWNEINAVKGSGWEEWTRDMLPELKRRFPKNLALQSLGSFDRDSAAPVYRRFSTMPGNEIAQVHRYLDQGAAMAVCRGPFDVLAADAVSALRQYTADRPVLAAEVGAVEANHAAPSKLYDADRQGVLLHDGLFAAFFAGAAGPGQFWHWQDYIEKQDLWHHFARFAEAVRGLDPRSERFEPVFLPHPRLRVYALRGERHTLIWVRDPQSSWQSELLESKPAAPLAGISLELPGSKAGVYDPWTNRHTTVPIRKGRLRLPEFRRSLVIRVEVRRG